MMENEAIVRQFYADIFVNLTRRCYRETALPRTE